MPINLSGGSDYIAWSSHAVGGLTQKTIIARFNLDAFSGSHAHMLCDMSSGSTAGFFFDVLHNPGTGYTHTCLFSQRTDATDGAWRAPSSSFSAGSDYQLCVTYDNSSLSNDPILYINGSSVTVTETVTPTGSVLSDTGINLNFGNNAAGTIGFDGKIYQLLIYNRILSASEILDAYNSRLAIPTYRGLVFAPQLQGAAGLQVFDAASLAAGNTIADAVTGALGVPTGSPLGAADTYLKY